MSSRPVFQLTKLPSASVEAVADLLVTNLAKILDVPFLVVERLEGDQIHVISMLAEGQCSHEGVSPIAGSPCERVRSDRVACEFRGPLEELFPKDEFFVDLGLQTYLGVPFLGADGEVLGIVVAMDRRERDFPREQIELIQLLTDTVVRAMELESVSQQLRLAQKMEAVGTLAAGVAHDFGNMLTVVLSYTHAIAGKLTPDDPIHCDLEQINRAAQRAGELTRQLLVYSGKQVLHPKVVDLSELLHSTKEMLARIVGEHIRIDLVIDQDLALVQLDEAQLENVITNLVLNARDAMPRGGVITVIAKNVDDVSRPRGVSLEPGRYVALIIRDTGIGMDRATQERACEPFFTTKKQGTGLGLSTVVGIVQQSGGVIAIESALGTGTSISLFFPQIEHARQRRKSYRDMPLTRQILGTVLVVEDEALVRMATCQTLCDFGYTVLEAESVAEALRLLEKHAGEIDLLLTDVVMPGQSGVELASIVKDRYPATRIVVTSGHSEELLAQQGVRSSDIHFLQKPYAPEALRNRLQEILSAPASSRG